MASAELSVVVPAVNGGEALRATLEALERQRQDVEIEVLVVNRLGVEAGRELSREFGRVRLIDVVVDTSIPQMRALAFRAATAPSVAVIEDHVIVPSGWARALLGAQSASTPVVGGPVDNGATGTIVDWAAFLCEYSACMPPLPAGASSWLPGNNIVYPRTLLDRYRAIVEAGGWENRLHDAMRADGIPLTCRPDIVVSHRMHYSLGLYLSQRFLYSRSYAADRAQGAGFARKILLLLSSLALPPVLFVRTVSRVITKRRYLGALVWSLPLLVFFVVAWAAGEAMGTLAGAGNSLSKVR